MTTEAQLSTGLSEMSKPLVAWANGGRPTASVPSNLAHDAMQKYRTLASKEAKSNTWRQVSEETVDLL
jgi:hypothetical protein